MYTRKQYNFSDIQKGEYMAKDILDAIRDAEEQCREREAQANREKHPFLTGADPAALAQPAGDTSKPV